MREARGSELEQHHDQRYPHAVVEMGRGWNLKNSITHNQRIRPYYLYEVSRTEDEEKG